MAKETLSAEVLEIIEQRASDKCEAVYEEKGAEAYNQCYKVERQRLTGIAERGGEDAIVLNGKKKNMGWRWALGVGIFLIVIVLIIVLARRGRK